MDRGRQGEGLSPAVNAIPPAPGTIVCLPNCQDADRILGSFCGIMEALGVGFRPGRSGAFDHRRTVIKALNALAV